MKEIRFRAWDKDYKYMKHKVMVGNVWDEDNYHAHMIWVDAEDVDYECESGWMNFDEHSNIELMQYTGLKDKKGVEIYEGDVVKGSYYSGYNIGIKRIIGSVGWASASFKVSGVKQYDGIVVGLDGSFEVIGNIYENPELLERK